MSQTDNSTAVTPTNHSRVFYKPVRYNGGELKVAKTIVDALNQEWKIHITTGPFRPHDLDFYSVPPSEDYDIEEVIHDITLGIDVVV